jgi:hypothetical protein
VTRTDLTKYRTFWAAVFAMGLLAYCALHDVKGEDLQAVKWGLVGIVGLVAGRAIGTAAAGGGGLKGAARVILTDAKPEVKP